MAYCIVIVVVTRALALRRRELDRTCLSDSSWNRPLTHMVMMASLPVPLPSSVKDLPANRMKNIALKRLCHERSG